MQQRRFYWYCFPCYARCMYRLYSYIKLPVVAIPCACVEIFARNRSPVASRSPPATVLLQRSHTCIYYRETGVNGMLSTVIRSHAANVTEPYRTEPCGTARHGTVRFCACSHGNFKRTVPYRTVLSTVPYSARFHVPCERSIRLEMLILS